MEGIKVLVSGAALLALLALVSFSGSRFAGDQSEIPQLESEQTATLGDILGEIDEADAVSNEGEQSVNIDVSSDIKADVDSSNSSIDFDVNISTDGSEIDAEDGDAEEPDGTSDEPVTSGNNFSFTVNGNTIKCAPGDRYRSPDRSVECDNDDGDVGFDIDWDN